LTVTYGGVTYTSQAELVVTTVPTLITVVAGTTPSLTPFQPLSISSSVPYTVVLSSSIPAGGPSIIQVDSTGIFKFADQVINSDIKSYTYLVMIRYGTTDYTPPPSFTVNVVNQATYNNYNSTTFKFSNSYPSTASGQSALWNATVHALYAKNPGVSILNFVQSSGSVNNTAYSPPGTTLDTNGLSVTSNGTTYTQPLEAPEEEVPCILSFSQIRMSDGTVKRISDIQPGEEVVSALTHKAVKVKAIRRRVVDYKTLNEDNHIRVIPKDFLGENSPSKDLYISGLHCVMLKVADTTGLPRNRLSFQSRRISNTFKLPTPEEIISLTGEDDVVYYHIDLDGLDAVYCEDLPIESYYREN
jgi:hypothetical protein